MARRFEGKTVLVTGGNSGIGLAAARIFADEGGRVAIVGRDSETLRQAQRSLVGDVEALQADLGDMAQLERASDIVAERFGRLDIFFANAGVALLKPFQAVSEAEWDQVMGVNLKAPYFLTRRLLPILGSGGAIIFCSSIVGIQVTPMSAAYGASKAALRHLARSLARELAERGVRVNTVTPGTIDTPLADRSVGLPAEAVPGFKRFLVDHAPMKRLGTAAEVAAAVAFLASDDASYINGAEILVDGGAVGMT